MVIMSSNNNNDNMLSTTSCNSSATTTANPILSNNTRATNTTSSCASPPLAAAMAKQQQQQQALKCPRCDSSNTKFCYYNNYSLSQPRHFCKACKRYWTRGGTLRNVPVGGGCRKNKRAKKAPAAATTMAAVTSNQKNSSLLSSHPSATATSDHLNSLFFDMPSAAVASSMNLASTSAFPTLPQMYNLQPQMSALGIRFSSGRTNHHDQKFQSGFASSLADLQQPGSFLNSYQPPYDQELHVGPNRILELPKQVKVEGTTSVNGSDGVGIEWQDQDQDQFDVGTNIAAPGAHSGDSSFLYWSSAILGAAGWPDIANSSIAPLI